MADRLLARLFSKQCAGATTIPCCAAKPEQIGSAGNSVQVVSALGRISEVSVRLALAHALGNLLPSILIFKALLEGVAVEVGVVAVSEMIAKVATCQCNDGDTRHQNCLGLAPRSSALNHTLDAHHARSEGTETENSANVFVVKHLPMSPDRQVRQLDATYRPVREVARLQ